MVARHRAPSLRRAVRWLAAGAGLAVAAAAAFALAPAASAAATVTAQLSLSGVATKDTVLGGKTIGVHPGDTVEFKASALPTAGLDDVPALGGLLGGVLGTLTAGNFQVVVTFGSGFPAMAGRTVTLGGPTSGACAGRPDVRVSFPAAGTYAFTWRVQYVLTGLLGCSQKGINATDLNQLKQAGVALNADNHWVGQVIAAQNPPPPSIGIQLPGVGATPVIAGHTPVPGGINLPGTTVELPDPLPSLRKGLPGTAGSPGGSGSSAPGVPYTPPPLTIPEQVVPKGYGSTATGDTGAGSGGFGNVLPGLGGGFVGSSGQAGLVPAGSGGSVPAAAKVRRNGAELATSPSPSGAQMPVVLAIVAVIALSLVTATYARMYLLRRPH